MAPALVGTAGTAAQASVAGNPVTPSFGVGESRTAGNLLVCWATDGAATAQVPTTGTAGWSTVASVLLGGSACCVMVKVAAGADAAPAVTGLGKAWARVAEFSGSNATSDQTGSGSATTAASTSGTAAAIDAASGELIVSCWGLRLSGAATLTAGALTSNNATLTVAQNDATSLQNHYRLGYGVTTANASATSSSTTWTTAGTNVDSTICFVTLTLPAVATTLPELVMAPPSR